MKQFWNRLCATLACLVLAAGLISPMALDSRAAELTGLEGKTLSILGDSISTYAQVSNGTAYNSTLADNAVFYTEGTLGVCQQDTWWQQTCDLLGMRLLVNNSWSGSCMFMTGAGTQGAYRSRCIQLHSNEREKPDIIAVYMGTNDQDYFPDTLGTYRDIDFNSLITPMGDGFTYAEPVTCMEAYAIALHKISQRYPDAEVYCFNLLQRPGYNPRSLIDFNSDVCRLARHYGAYAVELRRCGVNSSSFDWFMGDFVHPNPAGMDAITGAFVSALLNNSRYIREETELCRVHYDLGNVVVKQGLWDTVIRGKEFRADLAGMTGAGNLTVSITMDGEDITKSCYRDGEVSIAAVTGDLRVQAAATE